MRTARTSTIGILLIGAAFGAAGALAIRNARADQGDDVHRIAVATENIAKELDSIERRLERCGK
jgi:hypothetical protein